MCETCGCGDGEVRVEGEHAHPPHHDHDHDHDHDHEHDHEHEHVLADGSVVRHRHHEHEHAPGPVRGQTVTLEAKILQKNELAASENRGWFRGRDVLALNMMSSPGSGKTTLLEKTLQSLMASKRSVYVLEGDQETTRDADRIRATGAPALQINTGKGCHLEADMVMRGVQRLAPTAGGILFIENVGNLVCPALFDLGEAARVVLFSVTEGEDKPLKYPHMFRAADLVLLTKVDLLPHLDFDVAAARTSVESVKPGTPILEVSSRSGQGMAAWMDWISVRRQSFAS